MRIYLNNDRLLAACFVVSLILVIFGLLIIPFHFNDVASAKALGIISLTTLANYSKQTEVFYYLVTIIMVPIITNIFYVLIKKIKS